MNQLEQSKIFKNKILIWLKSEKKMSVISRQKKNWSPIFGRKFKKENKMIIKDILYDFSLQI